ncbi:glycosyl transferase family 1 [Pedobacter sp. KBW01]|uniref:glycosyltransferase family 4 protein n=1 Tax=Pedobacter sp. KBW01 TaxID=2153364 RepID=UPI000F598523|nr:glycosyltransferase family 4 protein [Pedobacter sp. KBW01]RQO71526.1 glycosyl transferase family 1 [Pedobacter sp. KBW01]
MHKIEKLAIIVSHPIQYYSPVFQLLAKKIKLKVFYTAGNRASKTFDTGFKREIQWDIPLLTGYDYQFLENTAKDKGTHHFTGIINPNMEKEINDYAPTKILIFGWAYQSNLKLIRYYYTRVPIYFRGDSTLLDQQNSIKRWVRNIFLKWVYRHIDFAFYVGEANKAYFKKVGLKDQQLILAPHAIDNERFAEDRSIESRLLRDKLGITHNEILILFAGKLEPKKNPELLLDAFINLDLKNTHLLFVGNGVLEEGLKEKVEGLVEKVSFDYAHEDKPEGKLDDNRGSLELGVGFFDSAQNDKPVGTQDDKLGKSTGDGLKRRIHFMDFQNQTAMPVVYQACDLFCLPSQGPGETWGLAVNEAMAAGKAVLVSDKVGCSIDLVKTGVNGAVFKSGDLADLKQKLSTLTENKDKIAKIGNLSQQIIKDWSFEKQVAVIVDTIKNKHAK